MVPNVPRLTISKKGQFVNLFPGFIHKPKPYDEFSDELKWSDINNVVLHLGGDAIGGYIHPELQQTNSMSPLQGIFYAKDLTVSAIEYIMQHGSIKNLVIYLEDFFEWYR
jgi:hypothetical protein